MAGTSFRDFYRRAWRDTAHLIDDLAEELEQGWESLRPRLSRWRQGGNVSWPPRIDVYEQQGELVVKADLPGVKKEAVKVAVRPGSLEIRAERRESREVEDDAYYRSERFQGEFRRTLPIPDGVGAQSIKASLVDGVLTVRIALPEEKEGGAAEEVAVE